MALALTSLQLQQAWWYALIRTAGPSVQHAALALGTLRSAAHLVQEQLQQQEQQAASARVPSLSSGGSPSPRVILGGVRKWPVSISVISRCSLVVASPGSIPSWASSRCLSSSSAQLLATTSEPPGPSGGPSGTGDGGSNQQQMRMSLQEALTKLVDAAVEMVEQGRSDEAVAVLKEGIATFEPNFPDSPELGELHNQVALLSLASGDTEGAVAHATTALHITKKHFAPAGPLAGHRNLRLGVAYFAQGQLTDAAGCLHTALEALEAAKDPSSHEARFYLALTLLAGTRDTGQVLQLEERLLADLEAMKETFGPEAMILSLALTQHDRLVHQPLAAAEPDAMLCEALLKQHARLLESVNPTSEDLAVSQYKLATFYYVQDMLPEAQSYVRRASSALRATLPDDHDLMATCKHRLGMICAVLGDHKAAMQLLSESLSRYGGGGGGGADAGGAAGAMSGLAREAELGLAFAQFRALPPGSNAAAKKEALAAARNKLDQLAAAIGVNHMLARGAMRHFAQMSVMAGV